MKKILLVIALGISCVAFSQEKKFPSMKQLLNFAESDNLDQAKEMSFIKEYEFKFSESVSGGRKVNSFTSFKNDNFIAMYIALMESQNALLITSENNIHAYYLNHFKENKNYKEIGCTENEIVCFLGTGKLISFFTKEDVYGGSKKFNTIQIKTYRKSQLDNTPEVTEEFWTDNKLRVKGKGKQQPLFPFKKEEKWTYYYKSHYGSVAVEGAYKDDLKVGKWVAYYPNGTIYLVGNYSIKNNKSIATGIWKSYWDDGTLANTYNFNKANFKEEDTNVVNTKLGKRTYSNGNYGIGPKMLSVLMGDQIGIYILGSTLNDEGEAQAGSFYRTGPWETYYASGELKSKGDYYWKSNDSKGLWIFYYKNGKIKSEVNYNDKGQRHGVCKYYHENGKLNYTENVINEELIGVTQVFDESGNILEERNGDGKGNVKTKRYYPNGNLKFEGNAYWSSKENEYLYTDNIEFYYENGQIKEVSLYKDDKRIKNIDYYLEDGTQTLKNGFGEINTVYNDGSSRTKRYENGVLNGFYTDYYKNGKKEQVRIYKNGKEQKYWEQYLKNGTQTLKNGNGHYYAFHDNGEIRMKSAYKNGGRDGITTWYYDNGQEEQSALYKYDENDFSGYRLEMISSFYKDGRRREKGSLKGGNGTWYQYDSSGRLTHAYLYEGGKKVGEISKENL